MRIILAFILSIISISSYAQVLSFECKGIAHTSLDKKIEMTMLVDLDPKTKKGCAHFTPSTRGHHCFDFTPDENLYTLHNEYKKNEPYKNMWGVPSGIYITKVSDTVINRKTAVFQATTTSSDAKSLRVVASTALKGTCEKSKNNGLLKGNKL
jgi:hypothetical protein